MIAVTERDTRRVMQEAAMLAGVSFDEFMRWPSAKADPIFIALLARNSEKIRANSRRVIELERVISLLEVSGTPKKLSSLQAIDHGYFTAEDLAAARNVTDADIDAFITTTEQDN